MPERVHREARVFVDLGKESTDRLFHRTHTDARAGLRDEHGPAVSLGADTTEELVAARLVVSQRQNRVITNRDDALLSAFATHLHLLRHHVQIASAQPLK